MGEVHPSNDRALQDATCFPSSLLPDLLGGFRKSCIVINYSWFDEFASPIVENEFTTCVEIRAEYS